jgi:hypothetical protein
MAISKPKTLESFPKFTVSAVRQSSKTVGEYQRFEIEGTFDPVLESNFIQIAEGTGVQWFWLLYGKREYITPMLKSFDKQTKIAVLVCDEKEEPRVIGLKLAYLSPYWQAFNVWMVLDPNWGWQRRKFQGVDAVAQDYEADDTSILEGREVRVWTKLEPVGEGRGNSRHYPATDQTLPVHADTRLVPGGWGHEHCGLCNGHIDVGMPGYCDPEERWICEKCYEQYVAQRNLGFVDDL